MKHTLPLLFVFASPAIVGCSSDTTSQPDGWELEGLEPRVDTSPDTSSDEREDAAPDVTTGPPRDTGPDVTEGPGDAISVRGILVRTRDCGAAECQWVYRLRAFDDGEGFHDDHHPGLYHSVALTGEEADGLTPCYAAPGDVPEPPRFVDWEIDLPGPAIAAFERGSRELRSSLGFGLEAFAGHVEMTGRLRTGGPRTLLAVEGFEVSTCDTLRHTGTCLIPEADDLCIFASYVAPPNVPGSGVIPVLHHATGEVVLRWRDEGRAVLGVDTRIDPERYVIGELTRGDSDEDLTIVEGTFQAEELPPRASTLEPAARASWSRLDGSTDTLAFGLVLRDPGDDPIAGEHIVVWGRTTVSP
jgi:hypothetical protein